MESPAIILIVDDEYYNRELLKVMLASEGFELATATSGEDALVMIELHQPDLILLDALMTGMDGYEVARRVKEKHRTTNIPIIMVSALDDRESILLGLSAGAEDFMAKPIDRVELCIRIRNLLRLKAYGDHLEKYSERLEAEVAERTSQLAERTKTLEQRAFLLRESQARTNYALGVGGIGVWEIDFATDGMIWSDTMLVVTGAAAAPATGHQFLNIVHPDDRSMVIQSQATCVRLKRDLDIEFRIVMPAGAARWIASHARCMYDEQDAPVRLIGVSTNIDARNGSIPDQ